MPDQTAKLNDYRDAYFVALSKLIQQHAQTVFTASNPTADSTAALVEVTNDASVSFDELVAATCAYLKTIDADCSKTFRVGTTRD